jgi:putative lipoic acid-binding regulatory protein
MRRFLVMTDKPKIEFPCRYPIKIIATAQEGVPARVLGIVRNHAPGLTPDDVSARHSSGEKFLALRVTLMAEGEEQLRQLYAELMSDAAVRMVF